MSVQHMIKMKRRHSTESALTPDRKYKQTKREEDTNSDETLSQDSDAQLTLVDNKALDRSKAVIHRTLSKAQGKVQSLHSFVDSINAQLLATGLAVVSIEEAPRILRHIWNRPVEAVDLLMKELGTKYHLHTYSYAFEKQSGMEGAYHVKYKRQAKPFTPQKIYEYAQAADQSGPFAGLPKTGEFRDDTYWEKVEAASHSGELVHYPADIHASLLGTETITEGFPKGWNMAEFNTENDLLRACMPHFEFKDQNLPGCTDSMLYVGAAGTSFLLHSEDQNLCSCNYLIAGAPKVWNGVPSAYYQQVVELVRKLYSDVKLTQQCPQAVMHKRFLIRPDVLRANGIPTCRLIQRPGDLVITAPGAFHFGYNTGFNVAEATNFATGEWWTGGHLHDALAAGNCKCKEAPRFHFDQEAIREALVEEGARFGIRPEALSKQPLQSGAGGSSS